MKDFDVNRRIIQVTDSPLYAVEEFGDRADEMNRLYVGWLETVATAESEGFMRLDLNRATDVAYGQFIAVAKEAGAIL